MRVHIDIDTSFGQLFPHGNWDIMNEYRGALLEWNVIMISKHWKWTMFTGILVPVACMIAASCKSEPSTTPHSRTPAVSESEAAPAAGAKADYEHEIPFIE